VKTKTERLLPADHLASLTSLHSKTNVGLYKYISLNFSYVYGYGYG